MSVFDAFCHVDIPSFIKQVEQFLEEKEQTSLSIRTSEYWNAALYLEAKDISYELTELEHKAVTFELTK